MISSAPLPPTTDLWQKYNVPCPRYTSYPTVPMWEQTPTQNQWADAVLKAMKADNFNGVSLYIHLPYCEKLCTYCGCNKRITRNHLVERPYINALIREWRMYEALAGSPIPIRDVHFGGGTPTFFSPDNLAYLMDQIMQNALPGDTAFSFEAHPANTSLDHLETLFEKGFSRLSLGIQDFDPYIQEVINREQTFEQVESVVRHARATGYTSINFDLIYGLPFQTEESVSKSIRMALSLRPERIAFYSYAHVPWKAKGQRKYDENDLPDNAEKRALYEIGRQLFLEAGYEEIGMDHFALPGDALLTAKIEQRLHRNFMGYTEHPSNLLIGLGASSISDSTTVFVQNAKKVEDYIGLVKEDIFPFFKGHVLNREDLITREYIGRLMCNYEAEWEMASEAAVVLNAGLNKLTECVADGLVEIGDSSVRITERGIPFLRNIAMAFDVRHHRNQPTGSLFSKSI